MRRNQVTITLERFGEDVPKELNATSIKVSAYADSNNVYEALAIAYKEILDELGKYQRQPEFGCSSGSTNITNIKD